MRDKKASTNEKERTFELLTIIDAKKFTTGGILSTSRLLQNHEKAIDLFLLTRFLLFYNLRKNFGIIEDIFRFLRIDNYISLKFSQTPEFSFKNLELII